MRQRYLSCEKYLRDARREGDEVRQADFTRTVKKHFHLRACSP